MYRIKLPFLKFSLIIKLNTLRVKFLLVNSTQNKRWNPSTMHAVARKLFQKIYKRKTQTNHNHEIHFLAREINDWLPKGIKSIKDGSYSPRHLKRYYFPDEMVDQLHITDRVFQHVILQQLKSTFKYVMHPNCYHLHGPTGVKYATDRIIKIIKDKNPQYILRADIKSFYKSIQHHILIDDIKKHYQDPKVQSILTNIIKNPIETPRGYKNPDNGIALRGPLSQFFSGIYLKPLDDAFNAMDVDYIRYQDDIIVFCKTKRQLNRCRRRMMQVLQTRRLTLSHKKSKMGPISRGFHFLGIKYQPTQPEDNTNIVPLNNATIKPLTPAHNLSAQGGVRQFLSIIEKKLLALFHTLELCEKRV